MCKCNPDCVYFNISSCNPILDRNGIKHITAPAYCLYDEKIIESWDHKCPRKEPNVLKAKNK